MHKLTPSQCKKARGLLKWNSRDLSHRTNVPAERINSFEKGMIHLYPREVINVVDVLKKEGIHFEEFGEVALHAEAAQRHAVHKAHQTTSIYAKEPVIHVSDAEIERLYGKTTDEDDDRSHRYSTD